jgi:alpha-galactosidase
MGWRSWNCYHGNVNQTLMENVMDAMTSRSRAVDGKPTSLLDLGYENCGLDDNWQACGAGPLKGFHDEYGKPIINTVTFPNMSAMTNYGHELGLRVGWYMNNCICGEHQYTDTSKPSIAEVMEQSAAAVAGYGFDGVKLDGCSQFRNLTWWSRLLNATGRPILIENCHWGGTIPGQTTGDGPCTGTSTPSDCPYNFFRTSGDIGPSWGSWTRNLQSTIQYSSVSPALSRPGTWAYPDMLEVGNLLTHGEDRTHFAAWAVVSAPLVLGFDLTDSVTVDRVWDIISNKEIIAVNQDWQGDPGHLVKSFNPSPSQNYYAWAVTCNSSDETQHGFVYSADDKSIRSGSGDCLDTNSDADGTIEMKACKTDVASQQFTIAGNNIKQNNKCLDVYNSEGPVVQLYNCHGVTNQDFHFTADQNKQLADGTGHCIARRLGAPSEQGAATLQLWAKKLESASMAALFINGDTTNHTVTLNLSDLGLDASKEYTVRDLFARQDVGSATSNKGFTVTVATHDGAFLKLSTK